MKTEEIEILNKAMDDLTAEEREQRNKYNYLLSKLVPSDKPNKISIKTLENLWVTHETPYTELANDDLEHLAHNIVINPRFETQLIKSLEKELNYKSPTYKNVIFRDPDDYSLVRQETAIKERLAKYITFTKFSSKIRNMFINTKSNHVAILYKKENCITKEYITLNDVVFIDSVKYADTVNSFKWDPYEYIELYKRDDNCWRLDRKFSIKVDKTNVCTKSIQQRFGISVVNEFISLKSESVFVLSTHRLDNHFIAAETLQDALLLYNSDEPLRYFKHYNLEYRFSLPDNARYEYVLTDRGYLNNRHTLGTYKLYDQFYHLPSSQNVKKVYVFYRNKYWKEPKSLPFNVVSYRESEIDFNHLHKENFYKVEEYVADYSMAGNFRLASTKNLLQEKKERNYKLVKHFGFYGRSFMRDIEVDNQCFVDKINPQEIQEINKHNTTNAVFFYYRTPVIDINNPESPYSFPENAINVVFANKDVNHQDTMSYNFSTDIYFYEKYVRIKRSKNMFKWVLMESGEILDRAQRLHGCIKAANLPPLKLSSYTKTNKEEEIKKSEYDKVG